jgi:hypothetical protein
MALVICGVCQRHVKPAESVCPFCGASVPTGFRPPPGGALLLGMGLAMASCSADSSLAGAYGPAPYVGGIPSGGVAAYGPPPCTTDLDCRAGTRCGSDSFCFVPTGVGGNAGSGGQFAGGTGGPASGGDAGATGTSGAPAAGTGGAGGAETGGASAADCTELANAVGSAVNAFAPVSSNSCVLDSDCTVVATVVYRNNQMCRGVCPTVVGVHCAVAGCPFVVASQYGAEWTAFLDNDPAITAACDALRTAECAPNRTMCPCAITDPGVCGSPRCVSGVCQ